MQML